jgi:hypothetical protein
LELRHADGLINQPQASQITYLRPSSENKRERPFVNARRLFTRKDQGNEGVECMMLSTPIPGATKTSASHSPKQVPDPRIEGIVAISEQNHSPGEADLRRRNIAA